LQLHPQALLWTLGAALRSRSATSAKPEAQFSSSPDCSLLEAIAPTRECRFRQILRASHTGLRPPMLSVLARGSSVEHWWDGSLTWRASGFARILLAVREPFRGVPWVAGSAAGPTISGKRPVSLRANGSEITARYQQQRDRAGAPLLVASVSRQRWSAAPCTMQNGFACFLRNGALSQHGRRCASLPDTK
jgi:hypothetical protein